MKGVPLHDSSRRRGPKNSKIDPLSQCLSGELQRLLAGLDRHRTPTLQRLIEQNPAPRHWRAQVRLVRAGNRGRASICSAKAACCRRQGMRLASMREGDRTYADYQPTASSSAVQRRVRSIRSAKASAVSTGGCGSTFAFAHGLLLGAILKQDSKLKFQITRYR
jgi:hypothetical protein